MHNPNPLYDALKRFPIVDLAPVYDKGVRGRTMSGRGSNWLLVKVHEAGVTTIIDLRTADQTDRYFHNVIDAGMDYYSIPIDSMATDVHQIIASLPVLFELMDRGGFFMSCAMGRHRTDIAIAFRYDDIAARLNSVMRSVTVAERNALDLDAEYETEFRFRKKRLFDVNSMFE